MKAASGHLRKRGSYMGYRPERLLRLKTVVDRTGLGRTLIYQQMDEGSFPKPVKIGARAVAWAESDIQKWIEERIAGTALDRDQ